MQAQHSVKNNFFACCGAQSWEKKRFLNWKSNNCSFTWTSTSYGICARSYRLECPRITKHTKLTIGVKKVTTHHCSQSGGKTFVRFTSSLHTRVCCLLTIGMYRCCSGCWVLRHTCRRCFKTLHKTFCMALLLIYTWILLS